MEIEGKQVDGFVLRPGDKLIVQIEPNQAMEQYDRFRRQLDDLLGPMGIEYMAIATRQLIIVRGREIAE